MYFHSAKNALTTSALWCVLAAFVVASGVAHAQSAANGKTLYVTAQVAGQKSCSNGACHGPDPTVNQNKIKNGTNPSIIASTIQTNLDMQFLRGMLTTSQLNDLAAYIANPNSTNTAPIATLSSTIMGFGQVTVGTTSPAQTVTVRNTGVSPLQLSALTISSSEFAMTATGGTCSATITLAVAASCTIAITFTPAAASVRSGALSIAHNAVGSPSTVSLAGTGVASTSSQTTAMVEYYFAALDYYFITSRAGEIALLDTATGWVRTGKSFNVYTAQQVGTEGLNRYYFDQIAVHNTRGSHFYTVVQSEKDALVSLNSTNAQTARLPFNEGIDSYAFTPLVEGIGGSCAAGLVPVHRIFRGAARFPDNPNHRFTTDTAVYNSFVALGWDGEGVKFCAPV
ncbi:MAG: choice-of-anchor D domain-containing protein [Casimicrobium sp.]